MDRFLVMEKIKNILAIMLYVIVIEVSLPHRCSEWGANLQQSKMV